VTVYLQDPDFTLHVGDVVDVLRLLDADSVHCVVTSPPYWALRDYGIEPTEWPEVTYSPLPGFDLTVPPAVCAIGLEEDQYAFVGHLVQVFREIRRVIRPEATVWVNIGDSYASKKGGDTDSGFNSRWHGYPQERGKQSATNGAFPLIDRANASGLKQKDLVGIPWLLAFALRTDGWWLRAENIWEKANPMPEAVSDRPARAHEQVFLLAKSARCFYDYVAVREPTALPSGGRQRAALRGEKDYVGAGFKDYHDGRTDRHQEHQPARRNLRSVWRIASQPYTGAHFAVFPPALVRPCILSGTSAGGCCAACGTPWEPINEKRTLGRHELPHDHPEYRPARYVGKHDETNGGGQRYLDVVTVGWKPACRCGSSAGSRPCVVLDPFMGSGTTALVARELGRHAIGIELNPEYARLAASRLAQRSLLTGTAG
jgi:DNA modification methylase